MSEVEQKNGCGKKDVAIWDAFFLKRTSKKRSTTAMHSPKTFYATVNPFHAPICEGSRNLGKTKNIATTDEPALCLREETSELFHRYAAPR